MSYPVTAVAVCNALGDDVDAVLAAMKHGRSGLGPAPIATIHPTICGAVTDPLDPLPSELSAFDTRQARIAWRALDPIAAAAERAKVRWGAARVAVIVGTSTGGIGATEHAYAHHFGTGELPGDWDLERRHAMHATVEVVRARTGLGGPAYVISTACSSSAKVLGAASRLLELDVCDAALVGGVDSLCQLTLRGFHSLEVLSPRPCRPFSVEREGINLGEGGAFLMIEREGDGPARLLGVGESSDAHHMTAPHPQGEGATLAMRQAIERAGLDPSEVALVNAHATGTRLNDAAEALAIRRVFGRDVPVVATKGYTGHMLGAAGATEAVFSVLAIEHGWMPASVGADPIDETLEVSVSLATAALASDVVLSNSFAFGGSNVSVIFGGPQR